MNLYPPESRSDWQVRPVPPPEPLLRWVAARALEAFRAERGCR